MAATYTDNGGSVNGSNKVFTYSFPVLQTEDIKVALNGVTQATTKYTPSLSPANITFNNNSIDSSVQESDGSPKSGVTVRVYRETTVGKASGDEDPKAVFAAGSSIRAGDLNANIEQALFGIHEQQEKIIQTEDLADDAVTSAKLDTNIDIAGTLDVTGATTLDSTLSVASNATVGGTLGVTGVTTLADDVNVSSADITFRVKNGSTDKFTVASASGNTTIAGTLAAGATTVTGNIAVSGTVDGRDVATDGSKLDGIEAGSTADQTDAQIRAAVEAASDSNVFTDADHSKLNAIEASATADQSNAEIRAAVEAATDSNVFTDADHTKLNAIEAQADVTDATNVNAAGAVMNTDLATKGTIVVGDGSGDPTILGVGTNNHVLVADSNEASGVKWATVPAGSGLSNVVEDTTPQLGGDLDVNGNDIVSVSNGAINITPNGSGDVVIDGLKYPQADGSAGQFLKTNGSAQLSWAGLDNAAVRTAVEAASDSNVFTDADHTKLNGIATSANAYVHPNHSGDVTSSADGATTIANDAVTAAKTDLSIVQGDVIYGTGTDAWAKLAKGTAGQALIMNSGATAPEWGAAGATIANDANNRVITADGSAGLNGEANLTFDGSTLALTGNQTATLAVQAQGYEAPATVTANWSIAAANNAFFPGPMTVDSGVTVTVPANRTLTIV